MNARTAGSTIGLIGTLIMSASGGTLSHMVGASWQFAGFAIGIWLAAIGSSYTMALQTKARIDALERKISELTSASQTGRR